MNRNDKIKTIYLEQLDRVKLDTNNPPPPSPKQADRTSRAASIAEEIKIEKKLDYKNKDSPII